MICGAAEGRTSSDSFQGTQDVAAKDKNERLCDRRQMISLNRFNHGDFVMTELVRGARMRTFGGLRK